MPSLSLIPSTLFLLSLRVARLWKYLVFLSPLLAHNNLDHWAHIVDSLFNSTSISFLSCLTRKFSPLTMATDSASTSSFLRRSNSLHTLPNTFLSHQVNCFPHLSIFFRTSSSNPRLSPLCQAEKITSSHSLLDSHISSKRKKNFCLGASIPDNLIKRGIWSDESHLKW